MVWELACHVTRDGRSSLCLNNFPVLFFNQIKRAGLLLSKIVSKLFKLLNRTAKSLTKLAY